MVKRIVLIFLLSCFSIFLQLAANQPVTSTPLKQSPQDMLRDAIINDSPDEVKKAVSAGAKINFDKSTKSPLLHSLLSGSLQAARTLINEGANPNIIYQGKKLSHYFIKNPTTALLLIQLGADYSGPVEGEPDVFTYTLKHFPNYQSLTYELVKKGHSLKPFYEAKNLEKNLWYQSLQILPLRRIKTSVEFFLRNGADPNQIFVKSDGTTWTPLLIATNDYMDNQRGGYSLSESIVIELLYSKARVNQQVKPLNDKGPQTPLSLLLVKNNPKDYYDLYNKLLLAGADFAEAIDLFLKSDGNPNMTIRSLFGGYWTLLGQAIIQQNVKAVKVLLAVGAHANGRNHLTYDDRKNIPAELGTDFSNTELALKLKNAKIIELLLNAER